MRRRTKEEEDAAGRFRDPHLGAAGTWKRCRRRPWVQGNNIRFAYGCFCMIMMFLMMQPSWGFATLGASRTTSTRILACSFSPAYYSSPRRSSEQARSSAQATIACSVRPSAKDYYSSDSYYAEDEENLNYYDDDDEDYYSSSPSTSATSSGTTTTTAQQETSSSSSRRPYWEEQDDDYYPDDNNNDEDYTAALERDVPEWEKLPVPGAGTAWVLLPPASVAQPTAILHFVGGTFTGSAPNFWYRLFLEDIVRHTSTAIVATSIPVTLTRSPLQHVRLAQTLQRQFQAAYEAILVDEYGGGGSSSQQRLRQVPICGLGHSLGARLLVVLATLLGGSDKGSSSSSSALSYKSMILISFTNFGAAAGIPGLAQLFRHSRRSERRQQMAMEDEEEQWQRKRDDLFDYDADRQPRRRRKKRRDDWLDDDDDDDDDDWNDIFQELSATIQAGTARVQNALTPASSSLEFHPTPEQLWKALDKDEGGRYAIPQTLVVQFDDDEVDQSSQLATALVESSDVKFARIRGTHLTPVATTDGNDGDGIGGKAAWLQQVNSRAGRILLKGLQGRQRLRPRQKEESLRELRQSIARYITEVVTKE